MVKKLKTYIEHIVDDEIEHDKHQKMVEDVEEKSVECEMFEVENDLNNQTGHDTTNKVYEKVQKGEIELKEGEKGDKETEHDKVVIWENNKVKIVDHENETLEAEHKIESVEQGLKEVQTKFGA